MERRKLYKGRNGHTVEVMEFIGENWTSRELPPRLDLRSHSPTGFSWGYHGSGPAQLAFAILADYAGDDVAMALYQDFKTAFIGHLQAKWEISDGAILAWLSLPRNLKVILRIVRDLGAALKEQNEYVTALEKL